MRANHGMFDAYPTVALRQEPWWPLPASYKSGDQFLKVALPSTDKVPYSVSEKRNTCIAILETDTPTT